MDEKKLRIFSYQSPVTVLGPGKRAVVWVQGCRFACNNCIVPESWDETAGEEVSVTEISDWILAQSEIEGITFSGGEPMLQAAALVDLVDLVRAKTNLGLLCYTGYKLEDLKAKGTPAQQALLQRIDLLIDGVYVEQRHSDLLWRGSSNQRLLSLTNRYQTLMSALLTSGDRSVGIEFVMEATGSLIFTGVPNKPGFWQDFELEMKKRGVVIKPLS